MPERFFDDDRYYSSRYSRRRNNSPSWLIPLLLLPIAFLAGWVTSGYVSDNQFNPNSQIEVGVGGGGPENQKSITPQPTQLISPTISPSSFPVSPTPTVMP